MPFFRSWRLILPAGYETGHGIRENVRNTEKHPNPNPKSSPQSPLAPRGTSPSLNHTCVFWPMCADVLLCLLICDLYHLTVYHYTALLLGRFFEDRVCEACTVLLGGAMVVIHCDFSHGAEPSGQALDRCFLIAPPAGPAVVHTLTHRKQTEPFPPSVARREALEEERG